MSSCDVYAGATIEMYFYGELDASERRFVQGHLSACPECRAALDELAVIRAALDSRPEVAAPAGGNWTSFMSRLDEAVSREQDGPTRSPTGPVVRATYAGYLAMAALLALVTASVAVVFEHRRSVGQPMTSRALVGAAPTSPSGSAADPGGLGATDPAFGALSDQHFARSKLVVLGLATKDPREASATDWAYERQLAGTLLKDTRLYKLAAQERGLTTIARVMSDLELVLLQATMSDDRDTDTLDRLQRLIRRRDLVTKMDVVSTAGL